MTGLEGDWHCPAGKLVVKGTVRRVRGGDRESWKRSWGMDPVRGCPVQDPEFLPKTGGDRLHRGACRSDGP